MQITVYSASNQRRTRPFIIFIIALSYVCVIFLSSLLQIGPLIFGSTLHVGILEICMSIETTHYWIHYHCDNQTLLNKSISVDAERGRQNTASNNWFPCI